SMKITNEPLGIHWTSQLDHNEYCPELATFLQKSPPHPPAILYAIQQKTPLSNPLSGQLKRSLIEKQKMDMQEEEYDDYHTPEPDEHTSSAQSNHSRYFFALMSFLVALIFLSVYLNNFYGLLSRWLLLLGTFAFGAIRAFFLLPWS